VVSRLDLRDPIFLGRGGGTFVLVGLASTEGPVESLVPALHERVKSLQSQLRSRYPAVKIELTGETPLNFDIRKASADDVQHAESLVIPATLALLMVAFGSVVAALIPLAVGQLAIAATLSIAGFLALHFHLSILVQNMATMLGLGLGIDYALLMVSRFREAICAGHNGLQASLIAARQAGHTLLISASTVAIGFLALLTVPISEIRSIGVAGVLVAGMSLLLATTVVPAVLAVLGPRINAGRLPFTARLDVDQAARTGNRWRQWGKVIVAHPWLSIFLAGVPLLLLGSQAARLDTSLPRGNWLPPGTNGPGWRGSIVARDSRTSEGFHRANGFGLEYARSIHQAACERPAYRPGALDHNNGREQPICTERPLARDASNVPESRRTGGAA
jgi:RND superfamily putative drug exporter